MEHLTGAETQSKRANAETVEPIQLKVSGPITGTLAKE
jgi:hypothetical protein